MTTYLIELDRLVVGYQEIRIPGGRRSRYQKIGMLLTACYPDIHYLIS
jgi:hypothetical protein